MRIELYLVYIYGDVDPTLLGPYSTTGKRNAAARRLRKKDGDQHGIYQLNLDKGLGGLPSISAFSGGFFK